MIVRVNDRGPFVDDRLIDLSYAAALKLDMVKSGTAPVRIETITKNKISSNDEQKIGRNSYIQVGAFDEKNNAYDYLELLEDNRFKSAFVNKKYNWLRPFSPTYQVQIGPFDDKKDYNELILKLKKIGVYQTKIIQD